MLLQLAMLTAKLAVAPIRSNGVKFINKSPLKKLAISRSFTSSKPIKEPVSVVARSFSKYGTGALVIALLGGYGYYWYVTDRFKRIPNLLEGIKRILSPDGEKEEIKRISELEQRFVHPVKEPDKPLIDVMPDSRSGVAPSQKEVLESRSNESQSLEEKADTRATLTGEASDTRSEVSLSSDTKEERVNGKEEEPASTSHLSEVSSSVNARTDKEVETDPGSGQGIPSDTSDQKTSPDSASESPSVAEGRPEVGKSSEDRSEEALSSEYARVRGNTESTESGVEQLLTRTKREYQRFMDSKVKLSENIKSQILETKRVMENPQNVVASQSLEALQTVQIGYESEYNDCREKALTSLSQLGEVDVGTAGRYEGMVSSAHGEVSSSLQSLSRAKAALQELEQREVSGRESLELLQREIETLQHELSRLKRESSDSREELGRKHSDSVTAVEGEARQMMYQLIEAHHDHMATRLAEHTDELNREWSRILNHELEQVHSKFQAEKSGVLVRMKGISRGLAQSESSLTDLKNFQAVRSLVDELQEFIDTRRGDTDPSKLFIRQRVLSLSQHLKGRPDLSRLLGQIPSGVLVHGLSSRRWLEERFREVERSCWRLAYVQNEQSLTSYVSSYFRSLLTPHSPPRIDAPKDLEQLPHSNVTMLRCARRCVQNGDLYNAAKLMNNLRGVARTEAANWVRDAVSYLETEQVVRVLYWYLNASILAAK